MSAFRYNRKTRQRGAALIIVLVLVATLSVVILSVAELTGRASQSFRGITDRGVVHWRNISGEAIASAALALAAEEQLLDRMAPQHPLFAGPIVVPATASFRSGAETLNAATLEFRDATRCFNVNSLGVSRDSQIPGAPATVPDPFAELIALAGALGIAENDATTLANVIADWIDADDVRRLGGAEDSFYLNLPTPYRTGGGPLADISELLAMDGVTPELFGALGPYLCARPSSAPSRFNVNMLRPKDAPLLVGMTKGQVSASDALALIEAIPPGGYESIEAFWGNRQLAEAVPDVAVRGARVSLTSDYIEVRIRQSVNEIESEERLVFRTPVGGGKLQLMSREPGVRE